MKKEVPVIGASAAGLYSAHLLACRGLRVQVFEGAEFLEPSARTLIVTSRMQDLLGLLGEQAVVNEIRRFELFTDGRVAAVPLHRPDLVIERSSLIRGLAGHAEAAGAKVLLGRRLQSLEPGGRGRGLWWNGPGERAQKSGGLKPSSEPMGPLAKWPGLQAGPGGPPSRSFRQSSARL